MILIVFIAGIFAAACNAGSSILQRIAAGRPSVEELFSRKFFITVTRHPLFLMGFGLQTTAALLQAVALSQGPISLVQPLLTTDLVFLLIFLNLRTNLHAGLKEWTAVAVIVIGLSGLFLIARPRSGTAQYALEPWIIAIIAGGVLTMICMAVARRTTSHKVRATVISLATAIAYAMAAGFTKLALHQLETSGIGLVLRSWPVYALIVTGILAVYLMQNSYGAGPLAISQSVVETVTPVISVTIGITIFGETVQHSNLSLAAGTLCAAILLAGIVVLGSSEKISPGYSGKDT